MVPTWHMHESGSADPTRRAWTRPPARSLCSFFPAARAIWGEVCVCMRLRLRRPVESSRVDHYASLPSPRQQAEGCICGDLILPSCAHLRLAATTSRHHLSCSVRRNSTQQSTAEHNIACANQPFFTTCLVYIHTYHHGTQGPAVHFFGTLLERYILDLPSFIFRLLFFFCLAYVRMCVGMFVQLYSCILFFSFVCLCVWGSFFCSHHGRHSCPWDFGSEEAHDDTIYILQVEHSAARARLQSYSSSSLPLFSA